MALPEIPSGTWTVDPVHTHVGFIARHMMISKVHGAFRDFSADDRRRRRTRSTRRSRPSSRLDSIDTGNADRDELCAPNDFFDVAQYPR